MPVLWREEGHFLSFELVSTGMFGEDWIGYLPSIGRRVSPNAAKMLRAGLLRPTPKGTIHRVRVMRGGFLGSALRRTKIISDTLRTMKLQTPHPEVSPLIHAAFSDTQIQGMGLEELVTFHDPILGRFLDIDTKAGKKGLLESAPADPNDSWHAGHGFALVEG